jgi:arginyl-tRNA synthetase
VIRHAFSDLLQQALLAAQAAGDLPQFDLPADMPVERPQKEGVGDLTTTLALKSARPARLAPMKIAEAIAKHLPAGDFLSKVEVSPPGFINVTLSDAWLARQVETLIAAGEGFGNADIGKGKSMQVEYVSANPTGPLSVGSGRNAILGDSVANILARAGYKVQREFYINDAGTQVTFFNESLFARYAQALGRQDEQVPENGYHGDYMVEQGQQLADEVGDRYLSMERAGGLRAVGEWGTHKVLDSYRDDLAAIDIRFDNWFSERTLYTSGLFDRLLAILKEKGYTAERDGAIWFTSSSLGEDKDNVIVRSGGRGPTYFASDIAYHYNKFVERGFDKVIDVWGADHQGHVSRMKTAVSAFGIDPGRLIVLLYQLVTVKRGGQVVRMSRRKGEIISLREVMDEVGADAVRYFLLARSADAQMDFDLQLAKEQSSENPVYYIQYAYARIASILRNAGDLLHAPVDVQLLKSEPELTLLRKMIELPEVIEKAAETLEPHHVAHYALELAGSFHTFYRQCRVLSSEPGDLEISKARLRLVQAAHVVFANTLRTMGMSVPEHM